MANVYFRKGRFLVSDGMIRAWNRSVQLNTVESIDLGRPLFLMALAGAGGAIGLGYFFADLLWASEILLFTGAGVVILILSWQIGSLTICSKLSGGRGWPVFGKFTTLKSMRDAIEAAMADRRDGTRSSDVVTEEE